jgi:uncharacterized protein YebE (UPF0316 family)
MLLNNMNNMEHIQFDVYAYVYLPLMIFILRIVDVSMGTLRIVFISKGFKKLAPVISFFEILIWIFVVSKVMQNLDNWVCYVSYAAGFATGSYLGMKLEEKIAIGHELIRVITKKDASELTIALKDKGYGITTIKANGLNGEVAVVYIISGRKNISEAINTIKAYNPQALYTIESIRSVSKEIFQGDVTRPRFLNMLIKRK